MAAPLSLTPEEQLKVSPLNLEHAQHLHAIAASDDSVRKKVRAMSKENDAHEAALKLVFTPDQFTQFLSMKAAMRDALKDIRSGK